MEREKIFTETGERKADGSVRFSAHQAGNPLDGCNEIAHNMFTYAKSKGRIDIEECGGNMCNYRFYNDATTENLPTFEKIKDIAATAGKSISAKKGVSLCGVGTEIMGLRSRPYADSTVTAQITVIRDKLTYGAILTFNGDIPKIHYEIIQPKETNAENSYEVIFKNCRMLSDSEIVTFKRKIVDMSKINKIEVILTTEKERKALKYQDFLYRNELKGSDNHERYDFHLKDDEPFIIELSDVSNLIKEGKGNEYELASRQCSPELSGGCIRYKGIATVCRGDNGWKVAGLGKTHPTKNNIRFDITVGDYVFNELHKESQVKSRTVINLKQIKDRTTREELKVYDKNGKEYTISEALQCIKSFCNKHKTDKNSDKNREITTIIIEEGLKNGSINCSDVESVIKIFNLSDLSNVRMNISTFKNEVLIPIIKREKTCLNRA